MKSGILKNFIEKDKRTNHNSCTAEWTKQSWISWDHKRKQEMQKLLTFSTFSVTKVCANEERRDAVTQSNPKSRKEQH